MSAHRYRDEVEEHAFQQREEAQRHLAEELPLFRQTLPYAPGSDTSEEAARRMAGEAAILRQKMLAIFRASGRTGLTADEACTLAGISPFAGRPRATELLQARLLEKTGERRRNTSGMMARVLRAVSR